MIPHRIPFLIAAATLAIACSPSYESGKTECSVNKECPSGFVCSDNGTSAAPVCVDNKTLGCPAGYSFHCSQSKTCFAQPGACSTVTNCGTDTSPRYYICTSSNSHFDCTDERCHANDLVADAGPSGGRDGGTGGAVGTGGATGRGGASGAGGARDGGSGATPDASARDASVRCTSTSCPSGLQCLGGQCCVPPASGGVCNQLPACGCASSEVCYPSSTTHTMVCMAGNNLAEGADCSSGLSCQAGFGCFGGTCKRYCSSASDCTAVAGLQSCNQTIWSDDDTDILGVKVCGRICDPAHPQNPTAPLLACPAGFGCESSSTGLSYCFKATPLPSGSACTTSEDCSPGYYCTAGDYCNKYCLANSDCPSGQSCRAFSTTTMAGSYSVGYCGS